MEIETLKIRKLISSLSPVDYQYLRTIMNIRNGILAIVDTSGLTKAEFCERFNIKSRDYTRFVKGDYEYKLSHMATINVIFMEMAAKKSKDNVTVKFSK